MEKNKTEAYSMQREQI